MIVKYSPQRNDDEIFYEFENEIVKVKIQKGKMSFIKNEHNEISEKFIVLEEFEDVFDFTNMPDGIVEEITTTLPVNPIIKAKKVDGVLELELLKYHAKNATKDELFPKKVVI